MFEKVQNDGYPKEVTQSIDILRLDEKKDIVRLIGSYSYRSMLYSGDIDLFEYIEKDKRNVFSFFEKNIKRICHNLAKKKGFLFGEVKMGLDMRYEVNIGTCSDDVWTVDPELPTIIQTYYTQKLLTKNEVDKIIECISKEPPQQSDYEEVHDIFRAHRVIRWSIDDVLRGFVILPLKQKMTINEAIQYQSNINIEIIAQIGNKYVDMSNFFYIAYYDENKKLHAVNMSQRAIDDMANFINEGLKVAIYTSLYSKKLYSPLKALKRYFSYARINKDDILIKKVIPVLNSMNGFYGSILSELKVLYKIIDNYGNPPSIDIFHNQLQKVKYGIQKIKFFTKEDLTHINKFIDTLHNQQFNVKKYKALLETLIDIIKKNLDMLCGEALKDVGLYPMPSLYLPEKKPF